MSKPAITPMWIELDIDRAGNDIRISARGSRGEHVSSRLLGVKVDALLRFASDVERAAMVGESLGAATIDEARAIQRAVLDGEVGVLFARLREGAGGPLLVRLWAHDIELQGVPWEALCKPGESLGFWGTSADIWLVRGVASSVSRQPREVRGAVKVLAIAPTGSAGLANLKQALADRIASGEVEWLDPLEGRAAQVSGILERLRREPIPHVLHFLGHGGIDEAGRPALRMANEGNAEKWLAVEVLGQQLASSFRGMLRLIVLEACEGAKPSAFASAAEILARAGADAVVAHLWPIKSTVGRTFSTQFYKALTGANDALGDVTLALNEARRAVLAAYDSSAEALSPVLYLRAPEGKIFDFKGRKVAPPRTASTPTDSEGIPSGLARIVRTPFSLVLGDRWKDDRVALDKFRDKLQKELAKTVEPPAGLSMSALAQWFALYRGSDKLGSEFQKAFRAELEPPPVVTAMARLLCPGVHTTLLRNPWLELSVAEAQLDRTIYVIQPGDDGALVMKREAGADDWEELDAPPVDVNIDEEILILRPYRGYTPEQVFTRPLLTEDDYYLRLRELWSLLPVDLVNAILRTIGRRPALLLGLSMLTAHHRMLLHNLHTRGVPRESLAVVDQVDRESKLWESGAGLPGKNEGVEVVETNVEALCVALETISHERNGQ